MCLQRAEAAGEGDVLLGREVLLAEEDHLVLEQRAVNLIERLVIDRLRQRNAAELGANSRTERLGRDAAIRHRSLSL
jgi:hypothetical protein